METVRPQLFANKNESELEMLIRPEMSTISLGATAAPFPVNNQPSGGDFQLRIFVEIENLTD